MKCLPMYYITVSEKLVMQYIQKSSVTDEIWRDMFRFFSDC